jgi:hypothetical protein
MNWKDTQKPPTLLNKYDPHFDVFTYITNQPFAKP